MQSKLKIFALSALLATFGLAACDTVEAKLPEAIQSDKILNISDTLPHNNIEDLFEKIVPSNSTTASTVLDELLFRFAQSYFGDFYSLRTMVEEDNIDEIKSFVNTHELFQIIKSDKTHDVDAEIDGVKDFYAHLLKSIQKSFWANVTNSSYTDRYYFFEKKFYDAQRAALYDLDNAVNVLYGETLTVAKKTALSGKADYESVDLYFGNEDHSFLDIYKDFITRSLLPDLYRKVIVENYIQRNNYGAIGRSHARKVQTISLKNIDNAADATRNLVTFYAEKVLEKTDEEIIAYAKEINAFIDEELLSIEDIEWVRNLKFLSDLYAGIVNVNVGVDSEESEKFFAAVATHLYNDATWNDSLIDLDGDLVEETLYYPLTTLGKIYDDYKKVSDIRWNTSETTDFTGSGAYTKETGLMLKAREVMSKNSATEGWYTSSGLSELPSDLRSRLFKIQVANEVDTNYTLDAQGAALSIENIHKDYGWYVQGSYYLTPETYDANAQRPWLYYDSGSTSWVIIRVDEAVKGPKLAEAEDSVTNYDYLAGLGLREDKETQNQIVWVISDLLGDSDSYRKAARQEILKKADIKYHDQAVYDYFKTNFPDLFD